jgi:hypothetical protein
MAITNVRDFDLTRLDFLTPASTLSLSPILVELCYQEDLFSNVCSGYVMITDSQAYAELLSLTGNEFLHLTFSKSGNTKYQVDRWFRVYKIDKRKLDENMYTESYCLQFCSEELFLSEQYKISKSYTSTTISSIINDICTSGSTNGMKSLGIDPSKLNIDNTSGLYNFVIPNLKPFDAINWLSNYALPGGNIPGADMLFFENKNGFNFKSLQSLMTGPNSRKFGIYSYDPKNVYNSKDPNSGADFSNVIAYEILNSYDSLNAVNSGIFANQLISVDVLARQRTVTNFDYGAYTSNGGNLNPNRITNNYTNRNGDALNQTSQAVLKLAFTNYADNNNATVKSTPGSVAPNIFAETYIPYRTAQLALDNYTRVKIEVPGDPGLTVGTVLEFNLLSNNPSTKTKNMYYSGNYLISAVKHLISENEYKTIMEIVKESVSTPYLPSPDAAKTVN